MSAFSNLLRTSNKGIEVKIKTTEDVVKLTTVSEDCYQVKWCEYSKVLLVSNNFSEDVLADTVSGGNEGREAFQDYFILSRMFIYAYRLLEGTWFKSINEENNHHLSVNIQSKKGEVQLTNEVATYLLYKERDRAKNTIYFKVESLVSNGGEESDAGKGAVPADDTPGDAAEGDTPGDAAEGDTPGENARDADGFTVVPDGTTFDTELASKGLDDDDVNKEGEESDAGEVEGAPVAAKREDGSDINAATATDTEGSAEGQEETRKDEGIADDEYVDSEQERAAAEEEAVATSRDTNANAVGDGSTVVDTSAGKTVPVPGEVKAPATTGGSSYSKKITQGGRRTLKKKYHQRVNSLLYPYNL